MSSKSRGIDNEAVELTTRVRRRRGIGNERESKREMPWNRQRVTRRGRGFDYESSEKAKEIGNGVSMEPSMRVGKMIPIDVWSNWN